ncbi:hypothetical protein BKA63DRAFT_568239 [Paraphoma chrysanthemicola]|nr:hypothetical protein BKA63DRAFT_568239 [Paraphoma chrysanthemicola]
MRVFEVLAAGCVVLHTITPMVSAQTMPKCAEECLQMTLEAQRAFAQNRTQTLCGTPVRDIAHILPIVTATSGALALSMVVLRMFAIQDHFAHDDVFAIAAILSAIPMGVLEFIKAEDGFGKDIWTIPAPNIYRVVKLTWLTEIFYSLAVIFTKLSFLFFCLRIFPRHELRLKVYALIGVSFAFGIAFTTTTIFNCTPIPFIWTNWDGQHTGKCINFHVFAWVHAALSIVLDILMIGVPIPELLRLSLSTKKKSFHYYDVWRGDIVSAFTTIVAILRLQSLVQFTSSTNPTYDNVPTAYWSDLEVFVGICCICMPSTRRFLGRKFPRYFGSMNASSSFGPNDSPYEFANRAPNQRATASVGRDWGIKKTMETTVMRQRGTDDELQLVDSKTAG